MVIYKVLNNNVVVIQGDDGSEQIVMGKGIAFNRKVGDALDANLIDKTFKLTNPDVNSQFQELVISMPLEHIEVGDAIVKLATQRLGRELSETLYVGLVDHIFTALEREKEGIVLRNIMLWDIKRFYKTEYEIGIQALDLIEEKTGHRLSDDEAGSIALHIANAEMDESRIKDAYQITEIMQEITNIVRYEFNTEFNEEGVYFYRFITHLKFFAQRLLSNKSHLSFGENDLYEIIQGKYRNSFSCVLKIEEFIKKKYGYLLTDDEKLYLTIHIERIIYKEMEAKEDVG